MTASPKTMTAEQYLELEKSSEVRHEFVDGTILAMAGSSLRHNEIIFNIRAALTDAVRQKRCVIASESLRVQTKGSRYRYPDVVVSCAPGGNEYLLENPCFVLEVLSESTAEIDNGAKLEEYTNMPSLQRYAIVSQTVRRVILYKRTPTGWELEILNSGGFEIPCLETSITLNHIYAGLEFASLPRES